MVIYAPAYLYISSIEILLLKLSKLVSLFSKLDFLKSFIELLIKTPLEKIYLSQILYEKHNLLASDKSKKLIKIYLQK